MTHSDETIRTPPLVTPVNATPRLLLLSPPQPGLLRGFSTGLACIQHFVHRHLPSAEPAVADLSEVPAASLAEHLMPLLVARNDRPLIVGIATTTASYQMALEVAGAIKAFSSSVRVVLGGHHASADAETVVKHHLDVIDAVVLGEGEIPVLQMLRTWPDLRHVPGIAYQGEDHRFVKAPLPAMLDQSDLDAFPAVWEVDGFGSAPGKFDHATYVSARGCPLACAFCAVANQKIRAKSVAKVQDDIRTMVEKGFSRVAIEDNFFAHSPSRTDEICTALRDLRNQEHLSFVWDCQTRVESLARDNALQIMADAGCEAVYVGVESLSPEQLLYLRKTASPQRYLRLLNDVVVPRLLASPVECYLNLQLGLPRETQMQIESTLDALQALGARAERKGRLLTIFPMLHVVYPGTQHFYDGVAEGRFPREVFEDFTKWEVRQAPILTWLGEHFAHGTGGLPEGILDPQEMRHGRFCVDQAAVDRIDRGLRAMASISGIKVFTYGAHLVSVAGGANARETRLRVVRHSAKE